MGFLGYFDRFEETKNEVMILVGTSLILNFGFGVLIPFIPLYAQDLGASVGTVGVIIAGFTMGRAIMASLAGWYSDKVGRKQVMVWGTLLYCITTASMAFAPNWQSLFLLRLFEGGAVGIVWPTAMAYLVDIVPRERVGEATGIYTTSFALGFFVGPLLGSGAFYLTKKSGGTEFQALQSTFFVTASLALFALIVIVLKINDFDPEYYDRKEQKLRNPMLRLKTKLENPQSEYKKYYAMTFFNGLGIGFIIPIFSIFFVDVHDFSEELVGLIFGISGGITAVMSGPSGALGDKIGRKPLMILGIPIMVLNTALLGFASTFFVAAGFFWVRAIGLGLFLPNFRALQADIVLPKERGTIFGRVQTFFNIGAIIGPISGSYLYEYMEGKSVNILGNEFIGEATPFVFTALFQSVMLYLVFLLRYPKIMSNKKL